MATSILKRQNSRTTCDRCYKLKERCDRSAGSVSCTKSGRRLKNWDRLVPGDNSFNSITSNTLKQQHMPIDGWMSAGINIDAQETELLRFLLSQPKNFGHHLVSPSFEDAEHRYAGALQLSQSDVAADVVKTDAGYRYASSAIRMLRLLYGTNALEATVCLTLGTVLVLSVYSLVGLGVSQICQHCLSTTTAFTDAAILWDQDTVSHHSFLLLMEIADCLVHCEKPTQRFPFRETTIVSPHLGFCSSLLPYYYDLCLISHSMVNNIDTACLVQLHKKLDGIRTAVEGWRPPPLCSVSQQFDTTDMVNLLAQAKVYRLAALLVGHRLQYPFGHQDGQANIWSKEIMMELELAEWATKQAYRCVTLPYLITAVEIQDFSSQVRALENINKYINHFMPTVHQAAKHFLSQIWLKQDNSTTRYWFQSLSKPYPLPRSLEL
ncbi:hypothetical protein J3F83DRAFT_759469 [Trichoderma novae-zelandiae]